MGSRDGAFGRTGDRDAVGTYVTRVHARIHAVSHHKNIPIFFDFFYKSSATNPTCPSLPPALQHRSARRLPIIRVLPGHRHDHDRAIFEIFENGGRNEMERRRRLTELHRDVHVVAAGAQRLQPSKPGADWSSNVVWSSKEFAMCPHLLSGGRELRNVCHGALLALQEPRKPDCGSESAHTGLVGRRRNRTTLCRRRIDLAKILNRRRNEA